MNRVNPKVTDHFGLEVLEVRRDNRFRVRFDSQCDAVAIAFFIRHRGDSMFKWEDHSVFEGRIHSVRATKCLLLRVFPKFLLRREISAHFIHDGWRPLRTEKANFRQAPKRVSERHGEKNARIENYVVLG